MSAATDLINELKVLLVESTPLGKERQENFQLYLTERKQQKPGQRSAVEYLALLFAIGHAGAHAKPKGLKLLRMQDDESLQRFFDEKLTKQTQKRLLARAMRGRPTEQGAAKRAKAMRAMLSLGGPGTLTAVFSNARMRGMAKTVLQAAWSENSTEAMGLLAGLALKNVKIRSWIRASAGVAADGQDKKPYELGVDGATAAVPAKTDKGAVPETKKGKGAGWDETKKTIQTRLAKLPKKERDAKRQEYLQKMVGTVNALNAAIEKGVLSGTLSEHVRIAKKFIAKHNTNFESSMGQMTQAIQTAGVTNITVTGRTKALESTLGKLVRKPKYGTADKLQDGTGMRVVCKSVQDVRKAVAAVRAKYEVVEEDNYIDTPQGDYRSHHLIIRDEDGLQKEIQIRTGNQNIWADWFHDVYKPMTPEQLEAAEQHIDILNDYASKMAEYFWQVDQGKDPGAMPNCPNVIAQTPFGCLS